MQHGPDALGVIRQLSQANWTVFAMGASALLWPFLLPRNRSEPRTSSRGSTVKEVDPNQELNAHALADAHAPLLDDARRMGLLDVIGEDHVFPTVDAVVTEVGAGASEHLS